MEWWTTLVGVVVGSALGYLLTRIGAWQESKSQKRAQLKGAVHNISVEVEANLIQSKQPWSDRMMPFVTSMWDAHKGSIIELSKELQDALYQVYLDINMANALFQLNLHLGQGQHYFDEDYKNRCKQIEEKAERARGLLVEWLKQQGEQVGIVRIEETKDSTKGAEEGLGA